MTKKKQTTASVITKLISNLGDVKTSRQLRTQLLKVLTKTISGEIDSKHAYSISMIANVILTSLKVQIDYQKLIGSQNKIDFFETK